MKFYLSLVIVSFIGVWIYRKIAIKKKIMDIPNARSSHDVPTPRGGGIAIAGVWFLAISYEHFFYNSIPTHLYNAYWAGALLAIVGIIDDIYNISPKIRFITQFIVSLVGIYFVGGLSHVDLGFYTIESNWILSIFAFVAIIWFINLFNFLDGIDGYLATETIFITLAASIIVLNSNPLIIASVVLGFLFLNWQKAKIFMGDVGSTLLGYNIAILAIYYQNTDRSSIFLWIMLSSIFWFDATLTLFRRFRNKEKLTQAHKKHAYQRITQAGFSHQKTVLYSLAINLVIFGLVVLAQKFTNWYLLFFVINLIFLYFIDKQIGKRKAFPKD